MVFNVDRIKKVLKDPEQVRQFCRKRLGVNWWQTADETSRRVGAAMSLPFHKGLELELERNREPSAKWYLQNKFSTRQDHAGFSLDVSLLGYGCDFNLYDGRHWNHEESRWYKAGEEAREIEADKEISKKLRDFFTDPANHAAVAAKMEDYIRYIGISSRAHLHEHFFEEEA